MNIVRPALTVGVALIATALVSATSLAAQADEPALDRERMTQYARSHIALNDARDEFHGKVGRIHDEQGRDRARIEMEEQVAAALEANGLSREEYDQITLIISLDGDARAMFDEIMVQLAQEGG